MPFVLSWSTETYMFLYYNVIEFKVTSIFSIFLSYDSNVGLIQWYDRLDINALG